MAATSIRHRTILGVVRPIPMALRAEETSEDRMVRQAADTTTGGLQAVLHHHQGEGTSIGVLRAGDTATGALEVGALPAGVTVIEEVDTVGVVMGAMMAGGRAMTTEGHLEVG
mmetsp:Transcript_48972/g.76397  ORF Transcript_48972/g.76397 Transcript_48972/m.76397 type:complete len:113 (-) Transcript_48972:354-692(-)